MKSPFWYVVKRDDGYYCATGLTGWTALQACAWPYIDRGEAQEDAERHGGRVVRVWARLSEPKIPADVTPFQPPWLGAIVVWRGRVQYMFGVAVEDLVLDEVRTYRKGQAESVASRRTAPPDAWIEAALRARAMLRAQRRTA